MAPERKYLGEWGNVVCMPTCEGLEAFKQAFASPQTFPSPTREDSRELLSEFRDYVDEHPCRRLRTGECALAQFFAQRALELTTENRLEMR